MYKRKLSLFVAVVLGSATLSNAQDNINKLTPDETAASYDLLFNGTDLTGWHGYRTATVPDAWTVKTTTPLGARIENGNGNKINILTDKKFKNFDFKLEVQTPAGGNSGIFVRYEENSTSVADHRSGPETQICGPNHSDCGSPKVAFGACYDMFPPKVTSWYNAPGSWNQLRIIAFDSNYVHYGNGKKLLEYKIGTQEFLTAYTSSKYASDGNNGRYYDIHPGGLMLQHHGEIGITFRNLKAKELDTHPFKREFKDGKWPDTLSQDFVFGKATTGLGRAPAGYPGPDISISALGPMSTLVKVAGGHTGFEALGIDGGALPFRKTSDGCYLLDRARIGGGIAILRMRADGRAVSRIIGLP
jgi:hypothetical protein